MKWLLFFWCLSIYTIDMINKIKTELTFSGWLQSSMLPFIHSCFIICYNSDSTTSCQPLPQFGNNLYHKSKTSLINTISIIIFFDNESINNFSFNYKITSIYNFVSLRVYQQAVLSLIYYMDSFSDWKAEHSTYWNENIIFNLWPCNSSHSMLHILKETDMRFWVYL